MESQDIDAQIEGLAKNYKVKNNEIEVLEVKYAIAENKNEWWA